MIREAKLDDMLKIKKLALRYLDQSAYKGVEVDELVGIRALNQCRQSKQAFLWVGETDGEIVAVLAGLLQEYWFSMKDRYGTDLVFVCDNPSMAPLLMKTFVDWAFGMKRVWEVTMGVSSGIGDIDRVGQFYESMGFVRLGGLYMLRNPSILNNPKLEIAV